jgi:uncharacterized protein YfaA (DUF2138 family)
MSTYILAVGFTRSGADPTDLDSTHVDMEYGFAQQDGAAVSALGSSGSSGHTFESVNLNAQGNNFVLALLTPDDLLSQTVSYIRASFRPAHDQNPASNLATSPFNPADTAQLLRGFTVSSLTESTSPTGTNYGLPAGTAYTTLWQSSPMNFAGGASGSQAHFEITVELTAVYGDGSTVYFKVDPELIIQY